MSEGTLQLDFTIPSSWPPDTPITVFEGHASGSEIRVSANPRATLSFRVRRPDLALDHETCRLSLPPYAFLKIAFSWRNDNDFGIAINGELVSTPSDAPVVIKANSHPPTGFRRALTFAVPAGCNDVEHGFLRSIQELQARVTAHDRHHLLQAASILRKLVLDGRPLVHLVNRGYRLKLRFPAVAERYTREISEKAAFHFVNLCPDFADPAHINMLSLDDILAKRALEDHERSFTVRDVVDICANVKGGVHFGEPMTQSEESILRLDKEYLPFFVDASLAALPGIAWTVIRGAKPLIDAILKKNAPAEV